MDPEGLALRNPSGCSFSEPMFRESSGKANVSFGDGGLLPTLVGLNLTGERPLRPLSTASSFRGTFFRTMGLKAAAGRLLEAVDDMPSAAPVAVLNYG